MAHDSAGTDRGVGFGVIFSILALLGVLAMAGAPGRLPKAGGFALAVVAGGLAVVSVQAYA
jgi:hypothetical protein